MYESFAEVYDRLMDDFDYDAWSRYYLRILGEAGFSGPEICECGCGTGNMTLRLARAGLQVTASDLSTDMLMIAQGKARKSGFRIPFIRQDMRKLTLHRPVRAVLACCDAVNYLTAEADVKAFFLRARDSLQPGGVIAFDISSPAKLFPMADGFYGEDRGDVAYLWKNTYDAGSRVLSMDLTFFARREDGLFRRFDELHRQRVHEPGEITKWLGECGFSDVRCYGDQTTVSPTETDQRIHFTAKRGTD